MQTRNLTANTGLTADIGVWKPRQRKPFPRPKGYIIALALVVVMGTYGGSAITSVLFQPESTPDNNFFQYAVYETPGQIMPQLGGSSVRITWPLADFAYQPQDLNFSDFRQDNFTSTHYLGSGILLNVSGSPCTVVVKEIQEPRSKVISQFQYEGWPLIVIGGETRTVSWPKVTSTYYGAEILMQDWRNGTWSPAVGILVEFTSNLTFTGASYALLIAEPTYLIPEFADVALPIVITILLVWIGRNRWKRRANGKACGAR